MQSLNLETLTDIKRRNWTTDQYVDFVKEIEKKLSVKIKFSIIKVKS